MKAKETPTNKKSETFDIQSFNSMKELSDFKYRELNSKVREALKPKTAK